MMTPLVAFAIAMVSAVQTPQAPAPPEGTGRISGVVTRGDTNQPLQNATIRLVRWEGGRGQQFPPVQTNADGRFSIEALRAGEYALTFTAESFVTLEWGQQRPGETARRVPLIDGQHFDKADISLPRTAAIEGRLLDEFGEPAPGMTVQAARVMYAQGKNRLMMVPGTQSRPTDDLGQFRIFNLPPSDYYLVALSGQFAGPDEAAGFALTYYPGTAVPMDAKPVSVGVGQDVTGVVFQMTPAEMSTISGVTTDELGKPIQATLMLVPTSGGDVRAEILARLQSGPDGTFVIRNVPAGAYALQGFGRPVGGGNLANAPFGALQLTVDGDMPNLTLKIAPGTTLRGRILLEGGATPPDPTRFRLFPLPVNFATAPLGGGPPNSVTNADWTFEVKNMNGVRALMMSAIAPGWMLKGVTREGKDITDQPVDFRDGDVNGVEITVTSNIATVSGTVTEAGQAAADCVVVLFAEDAAKWAFPSRYMGTARPDAKGAFTLSGLPSGNYLAIAVPLLQGQEWQNPLLLEAYRALATRVIVTEGGKATVSLRVIRR